MKDEITLLERTLDLKLEKYESEEFNETYVEEKVFLRRLEEIDKIQEELVGQVDRFLLEFPTSEMTLAYEDLKVKAIRIVEEFTQVIREGVLKVTRNKHQDTKAPVQSDSVEDAIKANKENNIVISQIDDSPPKKSKICTERGDHTYALLRLPNLGGRSRDVSCEGAQEWGVQESPTHPPTREESTGETSHQEKSEAQVDDRFTEGEITITEKTLPVGPADKGKEELEVRDDNESAEGEVAATEEGQLVGEGEE